MVVVGFRPVTILSLLTLILYTEWCMVLSLMTETLLTGRVLYLLPRAREAFRPSDPKPSKLTWLSWSRLCTRCIPIKNKKI
jgi:hypothetical protein